MKPESKGFAPGGDETSVGFCALSGSVVTECSVCALLIHSTLCPTFTVTLSGWYIGGLSVIFTTTAGAARANAGANKPATTATAIARIKIAVRVPTLFVRLKFLSIALLSIRSHLA